MSQPCIFISHTSADTAFCHALVQALRAASADVWYDEDNLGTGQLLVQITHELRSRPIFIVVLSPDALASEWVADECRWAYKLYKHDRSRMILPVVAQPIGEDKFNDLLFLEDFWRVDVPPSGTWAQEDVMARTLRALALTPEGETPAPSSPLADESADDLIALGEALNAQKKHAEAIPYFERAAQLAPDNSSVWLNLGHARFDLATFESNQTVIGLSDALALERGATSIETAKQELRRQFAASSKTHYEEALFAYDQALGLDPEDDTTWFFKGRALSYLRQYEKALAAFGCAAALAPTDTFPLIEKGEMLLCLHRFEDALATYDQAIKLEPDNASAWDGRAEALSAMENEARSHVKRTYGDAQASHE